MSNFLIVQLHKKKREQDISNLTESGVEEV